MGYALVIKETDGIREDLQDFGFSIFSMGTYRDEMQRVGMLDTRGHARPYPKRAEGEYEHDYRRRVQEWLDFKYEDPQGIPDWKLCSNDGWHVTPEEIEAALVRYEHFRENWDLDNELGPYGGRQHRYYWDYSYLDDGHQRKYWTKFIQFLRRAAKHGGFLTY